jgi:hypothetical protein
MPRSAEALPMTRILPPSRAVDHVAATARSDQAGQRIHQRGEYLAAIQVSSDVDGGRARAP